MDSEIPLDASEELKTGNIFRIPREEQRKYLNRLLLVRALLITFFVALGFFISEAQHGFTMHWVDNSAYLILFGVIIGIIAITSLIGHYRQKLILDHYCFSLEDHAVKRVQYKAPDIVILKSQITSITENAAGNIRISGTEPGDIIYIPNEIERKAELREKLSAIRSVETSEERTFISRAERMRALASLVAFIVTVYSDKKEIVTFSGTVYVVLSAVFLYNLNRDKNASGSMLTRSLMYLLMFAYVVYKVYSTWQRN